MKRLLLPLLLLSILLSSLSCSRAADDGNGMTESTATTTTADIVTTTEDVTTFGDPDTCSHVEGIAATCTKPSRCALCNAPLQSPLGHRYSHEAAMCLRCEKPDPLAEKKEGITRVVCVGDSITYYNPYWENNMMGLLDATYEVQGFGVTGSTALRAGIDGESDPKGYMTLLAYERSLRANGDIVVIMLGTNDTKPVNSDRIYADEGRSFKADMTEMVCAYQAAASHPRVYLVLPATIYRQKSQGSGINNTDLEELIIPLLREVAAETGAEIIDVHSATANQKEHFKDGVHPTGDPGRLLIATPIAAAINAGT